MTIGVDLMFRHKVRAPSSFGNDLVTWTKLIWGPWDEIAIIIDYQAFFRIEKMGSKQSCVKRTWTQIRRAKDKSRGLEERAGGCPRNARGQCWHPGRWGVRTGQVWVPWVKKIKKWLFYPVWQFEVRIYFVIMTLSLFLFINWWNTLCFSGKGKNNFFQILKIYKYILCASKG